MRKDGTMDYKELKKDADMWRAEAIKYKNELEDLKETLRKMCGCDEQPR